MGNLDKAICSKRIAAICWQKILLCFIFFFLIEARCEDRCLLSEMQEDPTLLVFISFSLPSKLILELDRQLAQKNAQFVIRGFPNGSFSQFLSRVALLKQKGLRNNIAIDPDSFEKYEINEVPSFVRSQGKKCSKVTGNLMISYVLELFETAEENES